MKSVGQIVKRIQEEYYEQGFNDGVDYANSETSASRPAPVQQVHIFLETSEQAPEPERDNFPAIAYFILWLIAVFFVFVVAPHAHAQAASTTPAIVAPSSGTDGNFLLTFDSPTDLVYSFDCHNDYITTYTDSPQNVSYTDSPCTHIGNTYTFITAPSDNLADSYCHTDKDTCESFLSAAEYDYAESTYQVHLDLPNQPTYLDWLLVSMWVIFLLTLIAGRMFFPPLSNKV